MILFQSINLSVEDYTKLNTLISHAAFHNETYGDSFFEFLVEHYNDTLLHTQDEHKEHKELPFKKHHENCHQTTTIFTYRVLQFQFINNSFSDIPLNYFYKETSSYFEKVSVFQPPKSV